MATSHILVGLLAAIIALPPLVYFVMKMGVVGYYKGKEFVRDFVDSQGTKKP